jgi:putative tryptophan/tyrosine transport system substrate-binding protein
MRRREFIAGLGVAAAWPVVARSQQPHRVRLIGVLAPYPESDALAQTRVRGFRQELAKRGWSETGDVKFDERWTTDDMDRVRAAAANLVELQPDVIACSGDRVVSVLRQLTRSIPIVAVGSDLAGSGFAGSLARPGGNVTGFSVIEFSIVGKMMETLRQIAPAVSRVGMIYNSDNPVGAVYLRWFNSIAEKLAVQPIDLPVHGVPDIERAVENLAKQPNGGVLVPPDVTMSILRAEITALAARHQVPAIYSNSSYPVVGGLVSYGPDIVEIFRRQASYVDRILRGEKAGDLPIQQPTSYQLVINVKTARALGLNIPEALLATADEVIQ